ncbi:MAG TPA: hypothetical protein VNF27_12870 [Candidatus Binataceae bacterium]|nr:hypothetical protein [Candidatus Binataceae bacterium]
MEIETRTGQTRTNRALARLAEVLSPWWRNPSVMIAAGLALFLIWGVSRLEYVPGSGFQIVTQQAISGDSPHYLIIINSLLFKHRLELQDEYDAVTRGGLEAGALSRRGLPDHHTVIVNRRTGHHALWMYSFAGIVIRNPMAEFRPGPDIYEVPAHPIAFPALLAIALAPFHPALDNVESDVGLELVLIGWVGTLATYLMARRGGFGRGAALLAAGLLLLASPWLAYSRDYFSETTIGVFLALAIWAWSDDRPIAAALFAAGAAFVKPSFAVVGAGFLIDAMRERRWRDGFKMAAALGVCALALGAFNYWLAGTPLILGSEAWWLARDLEPLHDTLLDPAHGLLVFAPWAVFGVFAIAQAFDRFDPDSAMLRRMAWPMILNLILLAITGFGPGYCYGPRYWVPFLPWLAVATVQAVRVAGRRGRVACALLIALGMAIAIPGALQLPQMYSKPASAAWHWGD